MRNLSRPGLLGLPILGAALALAAGAWAGDCDAPLAAMIKFEETPNRMEMTETSGTDKALNGGAPETKEMINTADRTYILIDGKWRSMAREMPSPQEMEDAVRDRTYTCAYVKADKLDGVDADLWHVTDSSDPDTISNHMVWVAKASGLPVRIDIDSDDGTDLGKSHSTMTIGYDDVAVPAGVE